MRLVWFWILCTLLALTGSAAAQHRLLDTSIRRVNWDSLMAHDHTHFEFDSEATESLESENRMFEKEQIESGQKPEERKRFLYYDISTSDDEAAGGFLDDSVMYMDLNHDGREDAILQLISPGSGIFGSFVIFLQTKRGPKFSGAGGGSHFGVDTSGDTLVAITGHPLFMDANCCPRAHDFQQIIGNGDTVRFLPLITEPTEGGAATTVQYFYSNLLNRGFEEAYNMLSPRYRKAHPYTLWLKGYADMQSVDATIGGGMTFDGELEDSVIGVAIVSVDRINGRAIEKHFTGVWHMKFLPYTATDYDTKQPMKEYDWFLDRPEIHEVK